MDNDRKILIIGSTQEYIENLTDFLSSHSFNTSHAASISETVNHLMSTNNVGIAVFTDSVFDNDVLNTLQSLKTFNPKMGIILFMKFKNPGSAVSLLNQNIVDHIIDPYDLPGLYSAVKSEFQKLELNTQNMLFSKKYECLKQEQQKNLKKTLDLEEIYDVTLENLMTALDLRDVETFGHSRTVAKYSQVLAQLLGFKDKVFLDSIRKGSLLHDVGKIAIPDSILKKPGPLSEKEWEKIRLHPSLGFGLIKEIKLLKKVGNVVLYHHERYDGQGYPKKLKGDKIPVEARIFALA
ncbi:MAG: HD domain-containing protein, partial [Candidatus Aminicenantes bacterium]|nr:HD domain-containing protein [Candidatus Aminicenantes bacterium]